MMLTDRQIFETIRQRKGAGLTQTEVDMINTIMYPKKSASVDPSWIAAARAKIGQKEIPGPQHNSWIADGWAKLGAKWYNADETPWCGFFVAWALKEAGLTYPKNFPSAASFREYGMPAKAQLGAIGVKGRKGGNHVFFIVGETPDKRYYKALGGNQSNMVSIVDIVKSEVDAIRWPPNAPVVITGLPVLPLGQISRSEA